MINLERLINQKGIALPVVLIVMLLLLALGAAAMMMSNLGYTSVSSNTKYLISETNANIGIMNSIETMIGGTSCGFSNSYNSNGGSINVVTISAGGSCFIWSQGTFLNSRVVKVAVIQSSGSSNFGPAIFKTLSNLSLGGSGAISSCDPDCKTPALIIGNSLSNPPSANKVSSCPNNPKDLIALIDPYIPNAFDPNTTDLTERVFKDISNRQQLLYTFNNYYGVNFNNGTPTGFTNQCNLNSYNINQWNVNQNNKIVSSTGNIEISWENDRFVVKQGNTIICQNRNVYLGQNAKLTINKYLNVGGGLAANEIEINKNLSNATIVGRNRISMSANNTKIDNVNMFAQNYTINANGLELTGGIIYSGGQGVGNLDINLSSNSYLGSSENPVLIISDNNINLGRNGNADIYGIIFATNANNNFNIGFGNGNFKIHGSVISNSSNNNNMNVSGNFEIMFDKEVINKLSQRLPFIKSPTCSSGSIIPSLLNNKLTVY